MEAEEGEIKLPYTPTWIVAAVCSVIVFISLGVARFLRFLGKFLKRKNRKPLFEALQKVKEELMILGFISLLLTAFQGSIQRICIPEGWTNHLLPCRNITSKDAGDETVARSPSTSVSDIIRNGRRLLAEQESRSGRCHKGKVPLLSLEAIDQLHIFIFILAITHVCFSLLTMLLGGAKIHKWKRWENEIQKDVAENGNNDYPLQIARAASARLSQSSSTRMTPSASTRTTESASTRVSQSEFIRDRFEAMVKESCSLSWLDHCFGKQFYGSVTKWDYTIMRLGFIMTHCKTNLKFDFHKYMTRALEADFKKVIGIRWYLWIFVVLFLLLNVSGLHIYFWIAFIPLVLLLAVGSKLEHVIVQLANEVTEKHSLIQSDLVVKPSDNHFWLNRPRVVLYLIHFILFQNAFEVAFFFWILTRFGFDSCIMENVRFIIPRLIIGVIIQFLCSHSTLPLYAIVTQMGSTFKKAIFDEHVQVGLLGWANKIKKRRTFKPGDVSSRPRTGLPTGPILATTSMSTDEHENSSWIEEGKVEVSEGSDRGR